MDFEYGPIGPSKYDEVLHHLRYNFPDEPLNVSVGLCKHGQACEPFEHHALMTLKDGLSVMAVDVKTGEIAGVALNGISHRGEVEEDLKEVDASDNKEYRLIFGLLHNVNHELNLFETYNVDKIFELRFLSVDSRYRGRGIANELFVRSEIIAEEYGLKIIKVDATSMFTQKICEKFGLTTAKSVVYKEFKDENGKLLYNTKSPHDYYKVMLKELSSSSNKG
ncbi:hypothetical protein FQR65_LT10664 [Abscondita terminalis]|nr:hypothetical protein FQR65_LT11734 [Abscondita terminalis]KAF5294866.1 hypothetical protein FQR65_LT10664 [Abscondita terminalis]